MIDHVLLAVRDPRRSMAFYEAALRPLGYTRRISYPGRPGHAPLEGLGDEHERYLLVTKRTPHPKAVHFAFVAPSQKAVRAFHEAALANGGTDNGPPGPRPHYFEGYYAAYVLDPDGYNVEALHQPR